jgi:UDP-glucose 4-epimerase
MLGGMDQSRQSYRDLPVLVTGGAGFIGSHLCEALVACDARVRVLDDLSAGSRENLAAVLPRLDLRVQSIVDPAAVANAVAGCEVVFHLAANASVPRSSAQPELDFTANAVGTHVLLEALRRQPTTRVIYASSAAVYGEPLAGPMAEDHPLRPQSPYGGSKLAGEYLCTSRARCYGLDVRRARIFNTYGPRQRRYVMYDLLEKLRRDARSLEVMGTGLQERDYCYVDDTVDALLRIGACPQARGEAYNIAGGRPLSITQLIDVMLEVLGLPRPEIRYTLQSWAGDVQRMVGSIERLQALGWRPATDLRTGLAELAAWHRVAG